jgi:prevent-host-death family protein
VETFNIRKAKRCLSKLVSAAEGGQTIIITRGGVAVVKLVPIAAPKRRGMLAGAALNFEASCAMDADIAVMFEGKA